MRNKRRIGISTAIIILVIVSLIFIFNTSKTEHDFITSSEVFNQEGEYFVYFWQEECRYCQEIEADIQDYEENGRLPLYVVDMTKPDNRELWYDWETHHDVNDVIIGYVEDGEEFYEEDPEVYLNDSEIQYELIIEDEQIIAQHQTAFFNPSPTELDSLDIVTTPALLHVSDTTQLVVGVEETLALLEQEQ